MKLVIHDLTPEEWAKVAAEYGDCTVVSDNGTIRPCVGCFGCWAKDPGRCVLKDGYENMGVLVHRADEVVVISRYAYGAVSGFVKNVFDRCLAYVLPQFEGIGGETHHKKRYAEDKPFTFVFYGRTFTQAEKAAAFRYVTAVCTNFRAYVKNVIFREGEPLPAASTQGESATSAASVNGGATDSACGETQPGGKVLLLNGSWRKGNSAVFAGKLAERLKAESETVRLCDYLKDPAALCPVVESARAIVLCVPLYVDGLPGQVVRWMETMEREYRGGRKDVYLLANMGLYESGQLVNLFEAVREWCEAMGFSYRGGLGISAGELLGTLMANTPFGVGPTRTAARGIVRLAEVIDGGGTTEDIFAEPWMFPRSLYIAIANTNWNRLARQNGIKPAELYRRL